MATLTTKSWTHRRRGVYLVEVLMAGFISTLIVAAVIELYIVGNRLTARTQAQASAWQTAVLGIEKITRLTRNGVTLAVADSGASLYVTLPTNKDVNGNYMPQWQGGSLKYVPGETLYLRASNASGTGLGDILWLRRKSPTTDWYNDYEWSLRPNSTVGQVQPVSNLTFYQQAGWSNEFTVTLTVTQPYRGGQATVTLNRTIYLRNHN